MPELSVNNRAKTDGCPGSGVGFEGKFVSQFCPLGFGVLLTEPVSRGFVLFGGHSDGSLECGEDGGVEVADRAVHGDRYAPRSNSV